MIHNWVDPTRVEDPLYIRATYFPVDWKSKVGNSDASANFKTDWENPIGKGDIIIRESGELLMLTWDIKEHMNNQATQAQICNLKLTLKRHVQAVADERGFVVTPAHDEDILTDHPATFTPYAGRPDYIASGNVPGINADSLMSGQIQFNEATKRMTINDEFEYGGFTYRITNVDWAEVNYDNTAGIINYNCKRVAGGMNDID